jgi:hypothetical protein
MIMPTERPASPSRSRTERLADANRAYKARMEKQCPLPPSKLEKLLAGRKKHIVRVMKVADIYKRVLDPEKKIKVSFEAGGSRFHCSILGRGFSMSRFKRPVVVVLDGAGRKLLFYKSTGINSGRPGKWLPFNSIKYRPDTRSMWYEKFEGHPNFPEWLEKLGEEIGKAEPKIELIQTSDIDLVTAITNLL